MSNFSLINAGSYFIGYKTSSGSFTNDEGELVDYDNVLIYVVTLTPDMSFTSSYAKVKRSVLSGYIDAGAAPDVETLLDTFLMHRIYFTIDSSSKNKDIIFVEFSPTSQINIDF